jgi:glycosyltransferase involved in cell wall biosynthesis
MNAKLVHDDLNAGGGSEYLAISTVAALNEMGFQVDLASFTRPDVSKIQREFGTSDLAIRSEEVLDIFSLLGLGKDGSDSPARLIYDDNGYDVVVNAHGDLLPYAYRSDGARASKNLITYCHFPLLPKLVADGSYAKAVNRWASTDLAADWQLQGKVFRNALKMYNTMMGQGTVLTNSCFSKDAIKKSYGGIEPIVVYPPVHVKKFQDAAQSDERENAVLVLSRFSPDKQIENAIKIAGIMKNRNIDFKMTLAGSVSKDNRQYLDKLKQMIKDGDLDGNVSVKVDVSLSQLLDLMKHSKVFLHPLAGEPFGIAIVEAMSAGLIPAVPHVGGNTEFVPKDYQFRTFEEAADLIARHISRSDRQERSRISEIASRFSVDNYKKNLASVIRSLLAEKRSAAT